MTYQIKGGKWVGIYSDCSVDSFYYDIAVVQDGCILLELLLLLLYIFGGRVKNFMF